MEYRQLGRSGLRISTLTLGTMTFGGRGDFQKVGSTDTGGARLLVDRCLDAGVNLVDTADVYSSGVSEEIVGAAIEGRRDRLLVATKARFPIGDGPNDAGLSRHHLIARVRGQPAAARHRPHRPVPDARVGRADPARGDGRGARHARPPGQGALRRLLELLRLAPHEVARGRRSARRPALREPADPLHAAGARGGVRAASRRASTRGSASSSGARSPVACCRGSTGAIARRPPARGISTTGTSRPCDDQEALVATSSTSSSRSPKSEASRQPRSRWPGCSRRPGVTSLVIGARTEEQLADNLAAATLSPDRRRAGAARAGQPAAAPLPVLAPGRRGTGSAERSRPGAARAAISNQSLTECPSSERTNSRRDVSWRATQRPAASSSPGRGGT